LHVRRVFVVALAVVLLMAGCVRGGTSTPDVKVSGAAGTRPTLAYHAPLTVAGPSSRVVWEGSGSKLVAGKPVLLNFWLENASTGAMVAESYTTSPKPYQLTQESLGADLFSALQDQRVGARIVQMSPAPASGQTRFPTVIVMDVLPTRAVGEPVAARAGLPTVTLDANGAPTVSPVATAAPPKDLTVQPLIKGAGAQVPAGAQVTLQYTEVDWVSGSVVDSTWATGLPVSFSLEGLGAWSQGLVEQTVGSQVMVVVPPSFGLGGPAGSELQNATLIFVVDILAASIPVAGATQPAPTPAPTPLLTPSPTLSPTG
jgi:peptidylprolyl isomerase